MVIIHIDTVSKLRIGFTRTRLLQEDGQVSENSVLDPRNVFGFDPVLGGGAQKGLRGVLVFFRHVIVANGRIHVGKTDDNIRVVTTDPGLGVQAIDVKGLDGVGRQILVVLCGCGQGCNSSGVSQGGRMPISGYRSSTYLFENLVQSHKVDVDILFQSQKVVGNLVGFLGYFILVPERLALRAGMFELGFHFGQLVANECHLAEGELFDATNVSIDQRQECFLGNGYFGSVETLSVGLRGSRHGQDTIRFDGSVL